jgi:hypothetical protein
MCLAGTKPEWEYVMRVEKLEFAWEFSQLSWPGQTWNENKSCMRVDESWEARVCMRVFSTLMPRSNENKSCMRVDESWEARVCMRVFSTLMPRSNENKSCMRVDESSEERICIQSTLMQLSWENSYANSRFSTLINSLSYMRIPVWIHLGQRKGSMVIRMRINTGKQVHRSLWRTIYAVRLITVNLRGFTVRGWFILTNDPSVCMRFYTFLFRIL